MPGKPTGGDNTMGVRKNKRAVGSCDSPLERGGGVCLLRFINTPLHPHNLRAPSQEGNLYLQNTFFRTPMVITLIMANNNKGGPLGLPLLTILLFRNS